MSGASSNDGTAAITLHARSCDAVLFDLDGVLTPTARVHAQAWKRMFDAFLEAEAAHGGEPFVPFDIDTDYARYVDGKPRGDGVVDFLASRDIELPAGKPGDGPEARSIHALGSTKDRYFVEQLEEHGVEPYAPAVALVAALRTQWIPTAVVSSSNNCAAVLAVTGMDALFDARVDGRDITQLGLRGKPAPDAFIEAARRLGVSPERTVVVEDAVAGVRAGRAGGFGTVIGVDRGGRAAALREAGADVVVTSLAQVHVAADDAADWTMPFDGFEPAEQGRREALCTLGNGYFATRGAAPGARADEVHYPGTYLAGGYNRLRTTIDGREIENEDLVNLPNWLMLQFRIGADGEWYDERQVKLLEYSQQLDLKRGLLLRHIRFEDTQGRRTTLHERRLVSMHDRHAAALETVLTPENWHGEVGLRSAIDARVVNAGAKLYRRFDNRHLQPVAAEGLGDDAVALSVRTSQSNIEIAMAARTRVFIGGEAAPTARRLVQQPGYIGHEMTVRVQTGQPLVLEKVLALFTSRDAAISQCRLEARRALSWPRRFETLLADHARAWHHLWTRFDMNLELASPASPAPVNVLMRFRLHMFHLLQAASMHSIGLDVGVPARGWTGEAYQGHVFWDELFIFPLFNLRVPEITRSLLMYRYRRLAEARAAARNAGFDGAMFPWQSGSNGEETTQVRNLNPRSQRWVDDHSRLQRHVGSAVAYNTWQYFQTTRDHEFLEFYGAELILEIAKFWSSLAEFDDARERYVIRGVMGPDEFHEAYPDAAQPGLDNNAYTNLMTVWVLCRALDVLQRLSAQRRAELQSLLRLDSAQIARWQDISRRMFLPLREDGIIDQFEGYGQLHELDWEAYAQRYGNIQRLDLILQAEGDSPNRYQVSKQPDVLMLFYLFSAEELRELFTRLGYGFEYRTIPDNVAYYDRRTSHGSTLGRVVHAWVLARSDRQRAVRYMAQALDSDVGDIQKGTTAEGVHLAAMAGTVDLLQRMTTGIEVTRDSLRLNPQLPRELKRLDLRIRFRGHSLDLSLSGEHLTVRGHGHDMPPLQLEIRGEVQTLAAGETRSFKLA